MDSTISGFAANMIRPKDQMSKVLPTTPDDRINWSPSPSSMTPIQIVAHAAGSIKKAMRHGMAELSTHRIPLQLIDPFVNGRNNLQLVIRR